MQNMLIFGGAGFLGEHLVKRYRSEFNMSVFSRDEVKHWKLLNKFPDATSYIGNVRDRDRVKQVIQNCCPHIIIIASALKQIPQCEKNPYESIQTNILGIRNIIEEAQGVDKCLFISTDKACMPTNTYGMCKAIGEKITIEASRSQKTKYLAVRYGNILESTGSIIPLFRFQAKKSNKFTVTHQGMTRFVMTVEDSYNLIRHTLDNGESGDVWIPILPAMKIYHLAELFSEKFNKPIDIIGVKTGEKIHEDLISKVESLRTLKKNKYYVIKCDNFNSNEELFDYSSNDSVISKDELFLLLQKYNALWQH